MATEASGFVSLISLSIRLHIRKLFVLSERVSLIEIHRTLHYGPFGGYAPVTLYKYEGKENIWLLCPSAQKIPKYQWVAHCMYLSMAYSKPGYTFLPRRHKCFFGVYIGLVVVKSGMCDGSNFSTLRIGGEILNNILCSWLLLVLPWLGLLIGILPKRVGGACIRLTLLAQRIYVPSTSTDRGIVWVLVSRMGP